MSEHIHDYKEIGEWYWQCECGSKKPKAELRGIVWDTKPFTPKEG